MEPKSHSPEQAPQVTPVEYAPTPQVEVAPGVARPERAEPSPERGQEQRQQGQPAAPPPATPVQPPTPALPADDTATTTPSDDNPLVAGDDAVIEKEWVDRAKKIIAETKEDPHRREVEVGKLQADYLKKRYGKDIGLAAES